MYGVANSIRERETMEEVFRDVVVPRLRLLADAISIPWVVHSDGDIEPFIESYLKHRSSKKSKS